jgi:hypothetical protein
MPKVKGSGALKFLDPTWDNATVRQTLLTGREPATVEDAVTGKRVPRPPQLRWSKQQGCFTGPPESLLLLWRNLVAQRDDCAKRIKNGTATKWTPKRLRGLDKEIRATWEQIGAATEKMNPEQLAQLFAMPPRVYTWQEAATAIVELHVLLDRRFDKPAAMTDANPALIEQRKAEQRAWTKALCASGIRLDQYRRIMNHYHDMEAVDAPAPGKIVASKKSKESMTPDTDKTLSLEAKRVDLSAKELHQLLKANGHEVCKDEGLAKHYIRRFVHSTLHVTLRSHRGQRTDLIQ